MHRRDFLMRTGLTLSAATLAHARAAAASAAPAPARQQPAARNGAGGGEIDWRAVKAEFAIDPEVVQLAGFFLAPHPRAVREAIERHRAALDANAITYIQGRRRRLEADVLAAAAKYLDVGERDIALTDSTTMGLGLLYGGLTLREGQEVLTTDHDHFATHQSLGHRARRTGCTIRRTPLYADSAKATEGEIVGNLVKAVTPRTRIIAVTWVHSGTGVCLPLRAIASALASINAQRDDDDRALLCVDGVHGLGAKFATLPELGCDFFIAGTHKWLFGPRGTGLVWGRPEAWRIANPIIPSFSGGNTVGDVMTPGGFHSFEHRWAANEAFNFHQRLGPQRVAQRIADLNRRIKQELASMKQIHLRTPMSDELSAGIVCFNVEDRRPGEIVGQLAERGICASVAPYESEHIRYAAGLLTLDDEVDRALRELRAVVG